MVNPKITTAILLTITLTNCTTTGTTTNPLSPPNWQQSSVDKASMKNLSSWSAKGKIGVTGVETGESAQFTWEQRNQSYHILLYEPFSPNTVEIKGNSLKAEFKDLNGSKRTANSPEDLLSHQLGWSFPVTKLQYWLKGVSAPQSSAQSTAVETFDEQGRLKVVKQAPWTITYQSYQTFNGMVLPRKLVITDGQVKIKFIFKEWRKIR